MTDELNPSKEESPQDEKGGVGDTFNMGGDFRGSNIYIKSTLGDSKNNVRLQNLRDFTVQIRRVDNDSIVGTGIAVSTDSKIVTCAHVVEAAGVDPKNANGAEVGVYFPQARGGDEKKHRATVDKCFPQYDDDIVLLQLIGSTFPLAPEQIAVLGMADKSEGNPFRTYGYSPIGDFPAARGDGMVLGSVEPPANRNLQVDPIQLKSRDIAAGMSGAAVLDVTRNLVVGLVAERYYPAGAVQDDIGYGVDSKVLTFNPFDFEVRGESLELRPAPEFRLDKDLLAQAIEIGKYLLTHRPQAAKYSWNNAPAVLNEWTGREHLLAQITSDWNGPQKHVTGLIGFGGEGKSSLARKWVDSVIATFGKQFPNQSGIASQSALATTLDGVFWWGFYENRSVDEFLEAALNYMSGGKIDPRQIQSSNLRAQIIGSMLGTGRYLFVLDGLEVMQHQEGDSYGLLQSNDLRELLTFFARPDNQSFCLITSRAPLLDLMDYTSYTHRDVDRLSEEDGRELLRRLGVKGSDTEINKVVADWDGHALTLSILAAYLAERFNGDIKHLADIPIPTADEPRYERVHRVLRRYDEHLTEEEREFLKLFSVFRLPVKEDAFEKVFVPLLPARAERTLSESEVGDEAGRGAGGEVRNIVTRLVTYRLIRHDEHEKSYTTHPLIRNHYFALFIKGDADQGKAAHSQIKDYYLSLAGDENKQYPTLDDLKPLIEVVHHACQAGVYDEGFKIYWDRISQQTKYVVIHQLGTYETEITNIQQFFSQGDFSKEPQISVVGNKRFCLNHLGLCLMSLGRLGEAVPFYERSTKIALDMQDWNNASVTYQNLADLHVQLGALEQSRESAAQALDLARKADYKQGEMTSLSWQGTAFHLLGKVDEAKLAFQESEKAEKDMQHGTQYLFSYAGVRHSDHLHRTGDLDYARRVTEANLKLMVDNHWPDDTSRCHRVLGDLDSDLGNHESARAHYESALKIARGISVRYVLIEALLARGRWQAKYVETLAKVQNLSKDDLISQAFSDLNEALSYCVESGYRIYEADVRVALAWAYLAISVEQLAVSNKQRAKAEAERALQMSNEMGYHWGKVDAQEVLERIESRE